MKSHQRGAVFVESIIVITALTLGLTGVVFFRDSYQKRLGVMRLARAAAIAHSMAGCKANSPRDWIGSDLGSYTTKDTQPTNGSARGSSTPVTSGANDAGRTQRLLDKSRTTSSDGEGLLNPITTTEFDGRSRVSDGGRGRTVFTARPRSSSFVTCGDEVRDGDFDQVLGVVEDEAKALFNTR